MCVHVCVCVSLLRVLSLQYKIIPNLSNIFNQDKARSFLIVKELNWPTQSH